MSTPTPEHDAELLMRFSPSVRSAAESLGLDKKVTSWAIVQKLCNLHPEYGGRLAKKLQDESGPAQAKLRSVIEWLRSLADTLVVDDEDVIHGRRTILGLAQIDYPLHDYLAASNFLAALKSEVGEANESKVAGSDALPPDPTPLHPDNPAIDDKIDRKAFARVLAIRCGRIWNQNRLANFDASFILHLHGPWGAGKSSLLNLLRSELQPSNARTETVGDPQETAAYSRWIVIDFNAWQKQRLNPPWWPLIDAVYREGTKQLSSLYDERFRARNLHARETWWRFMTANSEQLFLVIGALFVSIILALFAILDGPSLVNWISHGSKDTSIVDPLAKAISGFLALIGAVFAVSGFVSRSFLSGSARAAQTFMQTSTDPMGRVARHFKDLVTWLGHPIIIFIDDLDRCQSDYVVSLLEGIQTLFKDPRVLYVISGDRRWLYTCYEKAYEQFANTVNEPGRPLGCLFLEKAVQLSVSLPRLSVNTQTKYWDFLIEGESNLFRQRRNEAEKEARVRFGTADTQDEIAAKMTPDDDPIIAQALREEAVLRLATESAERRTAYFLRSFAPLLEPNPRSMKRLLNAYALHRDLAILAGKDILSNVNKRRQLVLWTIVCLRWPQLEELLIETPSYASIILGSAPVEKVPEEFKSLFTRPSVKRVFTGDGIGVSLDANAIAEFTDLRTSNSSAASVA